MPYLRLYSLELPRELKRTMVTELTQAVVETRHLVGDERDFFTIHFMSFDPENLAIGGKLIANGRRPDYHVEYSDHGLTRRDKHKLVKQITDAMARVLNGGGDGVRINVLFRDYDSADFSVGGVTTAVRRPSRVLRVLRQAAAQVLRLRRRPARTKTPTKLSKPSPVT